MNFYGEEYIRKKKPFKRSFKFQYVTRDIYFITDRKWLNFMTVKTRNLTKRTRQKINICINLHDFKYLPKISGNWKQTIFAWNHLFMKNAG